MKILVVDDELTSRELLKVILEPYGHIDFADDGIEALRAFNLALERNPYDLICLDIILPRMDGQEVLKKIRKIEHERGKFAHEGVKIIMITSISDFESVKKAFASDCRSYVVKPIDEQKIVKELKNLQLIP